MKNFLINKLFLIPRSLKVGIILLVDSIIILISSYLSLSIRFDQLNLFRIIDERYLISIEYFLIPILTYFPLAIIFKIYSSSFRYYSLGNNIYNFFVTLTISIIFFNIFFNKFFSYGAVFINCLIIFLSVIVSRKLISKIYSNLMSKSKHNTLIVCSFKNLHRIYNYLKLNQKINIIGICISDLNKIDYSRYQNYKLTDLKYINKIYKKNNIKKIFADKNYNLLKINFFKNISLNILENDIFFKKIDIDFKQKFINKYFRVSNKIKFKPSNKYRNKTILITGAGGSIGKNLFFELLNANAKNLILLEQDEFKLFNLKSDYDNLESKKIHKHNIYFKLGNLSDELFLKKIFSENDKIDYVFHTAAYKHVDLGEKNIFSFIKNNIFVTFDLVKMSIKMNVKNFVFISTDKAVNPKSIMGYTKNICEKIIIFYNKKHNLNNYFKIVRFGNVINSDGSVLPIFENQILNGGPVTVTDKNSTRYFMTIKNACQLVLNTIDIDKRLGIFILDMGKPHKILNIAKSMVQFYYDQKLISQKPKIIFIGLKHGEKIFEELVLGKNLHKTKIKNILFANEKNDVPNDVIQKVNNLKKYYIENNYKKAVQSLKNYD